MAEQKTEQDVLALVREKVATIRDEGPPWDESDHKFLASILPLVAALMATNTELKGYAIASETVKILDQGQDVLADLQKQLQEQAGA